MFIVHQFFCKINTNFVSLSVVCIVLMLVIGIFSTGFSMQNILSTQLRTEIPYEYSAIDYNNGESDTILSRLPSEIKAAWLQTAMNADTMIWSVQCVSEDAAKEFGTFSWKNWV